MARVTALSAVTLATADMAAATAFYEALGFEKLYGGPQAGFTSYRAGDSYLNLIAAEPASGFWGRPIFYVDDVDGFHANAVQAGLEPEFEPRDAPWRERYFHIVDPDGHEISFAKPLERSSPSG
ncbi:MAG: VOC family protein [Chloroflexi bacterium]|nr:VOC family protein [Chloroflexota bacterium]MXX80328.1 VOC family protein [Chloroflexota bacterium]MYD16486.1 VOC family protein [Chloroflexota bacterium]MYF21661.1 VOC family protein [Chloroflexota bacterium]